MRDTTFGKDVSINTECVSIGTMSPSVRNISQMHLSMNDILSNRSTTIFLSILNYERLWRWPIQICRDMRPCTCSGSVVVVLRECALTSLLCVCRLSRIDELLTRLRQAHRARKPATVGPVLNTSPTEMRTRYFASERKTKGSPWDCWHSFCPAALLTNRPCL